MQNNEIELTIPMMPDMEVTASKVAEAVARCMDLDDEKVAEVSMALIEACINSIEHSGSRDRNVFIKFSQKPDALIIEIRDKGTGFDQGTVEKPELEKKIKSDRKRGWGLHLMKELMDEVSIKSDDKGTIVTMIKKKNQESEE